MTPKFPLVDNMRQYGGNFVSKLADAMVAADPENFKILVDAFPQIVEKYTESETLSEEDAIRKRIDEIMPDLQLLEDRISALYESRIRLSRNAEPLRKEEWRLKSKLYIIQNNITKEQVHFSGPDANDGVWINTVDLFADRLKRVPVETRKKFAEWNGSIHLTSNLIEGSFLPTPAMTTELEA